MSHYLRVFNFLWRAKRMEYILTDIWKSQMCNAKLLKSMPGERCSAVIHTKAVRTASIIALHFPRKYLFFKFTFDLMFKILALFEEHRQFPLAKLTIQTFFCPCVCLCVCLHNKLLL